eukprot:6189961-Pleurochrysis_carterae.AAC.4
MRRARPFAASPPPRLVAPAVAVSAVSQPRTERCAGCGQISVRRSMRGASPESWAHARGAHYL